MEVAAGFGEFSDAVDEKSNVFAEVSFDLLEGERSVFDGVVEDTGDDGVFIHAPFLEDFLDGERMDNIGVAGEAGLTGVSLSGDGDGFVDAGH